jgi:hypothetical protein
MKKYSLNIAGYKIGFESSDPGLILTPSARFLRNICSDENPDIIIVVHSEKFNLPADAERVFHSPLVEEINNILIKSSDNFWSVYKHRADLYIKTVFPYSDSGKEAILKFSLSSREWDLFITKAGDETDPFEYPLDGLVLYYLTVLYGDMMIHASGVNHFGHGYLFSGVSGKGKSTIAGLWEASGAKVIHDDRLIIRNISGFYRMFNTPVYNNDTPSDSVLTRIYLIEHGSENKLIPLKEATAVSHVMANCIQHTWNSEIIAGLMGSLSVMCTIIPVFKLSFKPDRSITDFIFQYE